MGRLRRTNRDTPPGRGGRRAVLRRAAALAAVLALWACGCGKVQEQLIDYDQLVKDTLAREYSFTAELVYDGGGATARVVKTGAADVQMDFSAPEALEGLSVTASGEELRVRYRGMDVDLSAYALPTQSILPLLQQILTGEPEGELTVEAGEDTVTAGGSILLADYELVFDKETMALLEVRVPSIEGQVTVSDFTFLS